MSKIIRRVFVAYPSENQELTSTILAGVEKAEAWGGKKQNITPWPYMTILGKALDDEVRNSINNCDFIFCDITIPNLNVYYEIGYAIGLGKNVAPIVNRSFDKAQTKINSDGIFDGIGYAAYENSEELSNIFRQDPEVQLIDLYSKSLNNQQPLFVLDSQIKTDYRNAIFSSIKSSRVFFRSFDPVESSRFSCTQMISEVTSSSGIIIPFLSENIVGSERHNLRGAFLAGLSHGLKKPSLILQRDDNMMPLDYRNFVETVRDENAITAATALFCQESILHTQTISTKDSPVEKSILQELTLGQSAAENEFRSLSDYFVETSEYLKTLRGEARVVAGRKGSGKTAIFFQVRDKIRREKSTLNIDLKPESHQLSLFREQLLEFADVGLFDHTLTAFWDFVLLSEVLLKFGEYFKRKSKIDSEALGKLKSIEDVLGNYEILQSGDFTARLTKLGNSIVQEISALRGKNQTLSPEKLTNIIYSHGISDFSKLVDQLSGDVDRIVFLFDNIDKGWISTGVDEFDVRMVRLLIEALDKIKHRLSDKNKNFSSTVFLRNDIYELLIDQTPDRGKSGLLKIDWTDRSKLKHLIHLRLQASTKNDSENFEKLWEKYFVKKVNGQDTFEYFVDHCLMRPRFLINIVEYAISNAINRGHNKVLSDDCIDAVIQHSRSLLVEIGYEIQDASGLSGESLNYLELLETTFSKSKILDVMAEANLPFDACERIFELLLWYGVIGVLGKNGKTKFVYDYDYDIKKLKFKYSVNNNGDCFTLNPAFSVDFNEMD